MSHFAGVSRSQDQNRPQLKGRHLSVVSLGLVRAGEKGMDIDKLKHQKTHSYKDSMVLLK